MTRKFLILLAVFLATAAFGAGSGGAAVGDPASGFLDFNPATGQMSYATSAKSIWPDGHDDVTVAIAYPGYYAIQPDDWQFGVAHSANVSKYCAFYADGWSCPASSLSIKTGKGNDTITIPYAVKLPTILEGGLGTDVIYGGGGPDVIWGGCSADPSCDTKTNSLHGGEGNDVVHGGAGNYDYVAGDAGDDVLDGGLGGVHDNLYGGDGRDTADYSGRTTPIVASLNGLADDGQPGENDFIASDVEAIQGGSGNDTLYANFFYSSVNILKGGPGNDSLIGYSGADLLMGEAGNDELRPGSGADNVYGGNGLDTVSYGERVNPLTVTLDGLANDGEGGETDNVMQDVEAVVGGSANDTLVGNANANVLTGGAGNDTLDGKGGQPDTLLGGPGNDRLDGGPAGSNADTLDGGGDTDMAYYASRSDDLLIQLGVKTGQEDAIVNVENAQGGSGNDTIVGTDGPNAFFGNGGNDAIQGNGGDDHLYGGAGNDTLWGNAGTDTIAGSIGDDTIDGGPGADWMSGWDGNDIVTYASYAVPVIVSLDGSANDGAAGEGDNVVPGVETVIGGQKGDTLTGDGFANWLVGGPGNDKLFGLGGDDVLDGQSGTDTVDGGTATDTCMAETKTGCEK